MSMANVDAVMRCNWGKSRSYNPRSLARFVAVLGRSGITEETGDFNARFRLIDHILSGYAAAALMTQATKLAKRPVRTPKDQAHWVEMNDWRALVDGVVSYYFAIGKVAFQRSEAVDRITS